MTERVIFYISTVVLILIHFGFWLFAIYCGVQIAQWLEWIK